IEASVFTEIADIAPDPNPDQVLRTGDRVFMRILNDLLPLERVPENQIVQQNLAEELILQDLAKWIMLYQQYKPLDLSAKLYKLVCDSNWQQVVAAGAPEPVGWRAPPNLAG